jgi:hypothetical protein
MTAGHAVRCIPAPTTLPDLDLSPSQSSHDSDPDGVLIDAWALAVRQADRQKPACRHLLS